MNQRILLMTSTIQPRAGEPLLARTDPKDRLNDYKKALSFYLTFLGKGIDKIVYVDNSAYDLMPLKELVPDHENRVEFISYFGLDYDLSFGRGYGEFKLLDYAHKNSKTLLAGDKKDLILKITGRYLMLNFGSLLKKMPEGFQFYTNFRNRPVYWADMFFMAWDREFYSTYLYGLYPQLKLDQHGLAPEVIFRKYLEEQGPPDEICRRYPVIPRVDAPKGMNNKGYRNLTNSIKYYARALFNRLFPGFWI